MCCLCGSLGMDFCAILYELECSNGSCLFLFFKSFYLFSFYLALIHLLTSLFFISFYPCASFFYHDLVSLSLFHRISKEHSIVFFSDEEYFIYLSPYLLFPLLSSLPFFSIFRPSAILGLRFCSRFEEKQKE